LLYAVFAHCECDCVDRLPTVDPAHSSDGDKCSLDNKLLAEAKQAADGFVCYRNKPPLKFVVPMKHTLVNGRNEGLMSEQSAHVNVARPVVIRTLNQTRSLSDKCLYTSSNLKLPDLQSIYTCESSTDEFLCSSLQGRSSEPNLVSQCKAKDSSFIDTANDSVVKNDGLQTSLTMTAPHQQQTHADVTVLNDLAPICNNTDKHSGLSNLSKKVVDTREQSGASLFTINSVRTQRLICRDSQLKRIANKSKLITIKAGAGSLLMSRNIGNSSRLSLQDAVGGTRPHTCSLLEVSFRISNRIM